MTTDTIDSNSTGLAFAEEVSLKVLSNSPIWYDIEPNSYPDTGGDITNTPREPINPNRQNKKGVVTDLDAGIGFNIDKTQNNLVRLLQGFMFADARQPTTTAPLNGTQIALTSVTSGTKTYAAASGLASFLANQLVLAQGFTNASNNGLKTVVSSTAGTVVVAETVVTEAAPPAAAKLSCVGFQFASADVNIAVLNGIPSLTSTVFNFLTAPDLFVGKWVYLGDDTAGNRFANNIGYCRIGAIAQNSLTFDDTTFTPANETGTAKIIRLYVGTSIKNELAPLIKKRSYTFERRLGIGISAVQAEYLIGSYANEFKLNVPNSDIVRADLAFVSCDTQYASGEAGDTVKTGTHVAILDENAINTASNVYRQKLSIKNPTNSNDTSLFGYATEAELNISNGIEPNKAIGTLGAFSMSAGNFVGSGTITCYFSTIAAVKAIRNNADIGYSIIYAASNSGFIFDIPLLGSAGGRINVEKDKPVMLPIDLTGAQNANGYTMLYDNFAYLPNLAMPV